LGVGSSPSEWDRHDPSIFTLDQRWLDVKSESNIEGENIRTL